MLGLVLLIAAQSTFVGIFYYRNATSSYIDNAIQTTLNVLGSDAQFIDGTLHRIQEQANKLAVNNDLFDLMLMMAQRQYSDYNWTRDLKKLIYPYLGDFEDIRDINMLFERLDYSYNNSIRYKYAEFFESGLYSEELASGLYQRWMPSEPIGEYAQTNLNASKRERLNRTPVFRLIKQLNLSVVLNDQILVLPATYKKPVLIIDIDPSLYGDVLAQSKPTEHSGYFVTTPEGEVVACNDAARIGRTADFSHLSEPIPTDACVYGEYVFDDKPSLVFSTASEVNGWILSIIVPLSDITQSATNNLAIIVVVIVLSMILVIALILAFVYRSVQPVSQIAKQVERIELDSGGVLIKKPNMSETELIASSIGSMNQRIEKLMQENTEIARREQEATILSLEMQINPHFLYNSLNKIHLTLHNAGFAELAESILTLSGVLRYSIDSKEHVVYMHRDLKQLQQYITACKTEQESRFSVYFDIDAQMYDSIVPKMLLQPFVENSILHGFRDRKSGGVIRIAGHVQGDISVFTIEDNGAGIPEDRFYILTEGAEGHIGCANVHRRIKLLYGDPYGISVRSGPEGTRIEIRLPYIVEAVAD